MIMNMNDRGREKSCLIEMNMGLETFININ